MGQVHHSKMSTKQRNTALSWVDYIKIWYPEFCSNTYFIPPVLLEDSQSASVLPENPNNPWNQLRIPETSRRVLCSLKHLERVNRDGGMMVVSQLPFGKYLNRPAYAAAVKQCRTVSDFPIEYRRGEFDVLLIHLEHGIITIQVKSVGTNFSSSDLTDEEKTELLNQVKDAVDKLDIAGKVLQHLISDIRGVAVTKVLALPNVSTLQLKRALRSEYNGKNRNLIFDKKTFKTFFTCFDARSIPDATEICLSRDKLDGENLDDWWESLTFNIRQKSQNGLTNEVYEKIVSRFCGPATMVDVFCVFPNRLELKGEDTKEETWDRVTNFQLYPNQLKIVVDPARMVYLTGPPGTGKTIVLVLKALLWLQQGQNVQVVSTWYKSPASSFMIQYQAEKTFEMCSKIRSVSSDTQPIISFHKWDFVKEGDTQSARDDEVKSAVEYLKGNAKDGHVYVITDEPGPDIREDALQVFVENFQTFKRSLSQDEAVPFIKKVFYLTNQEASNKFDTFKKNEQLSLGEFQKLYATMKKGEDALQVFVENFKTFKRSLSQDEAVPFIEKFFNLTNQEASNKFDTFKKNEQLSLGEFQKLYATMTKRNMFTVFCDSLKEAVPNLYLWAASNEHTNIPKGLFEKRELTIALRSPSAIVDKVKNSPIMRDGSTIEPYSEYSPVPSEGTSRELSHQGHLEKLPQDCEVCGRQIAEELKNLYVGCEPAQSSHATGALQYRDVLVICEDVVDEKVNENKPASGLVQGLRKWECKGYKQFPVRVVEKEAGDKAINDTALALSNMVTVSHYLHVTGLERKVVVLAGDCTWKNMYWELYDVSRSTAHLIFIKQNN